ncbi:MAG: histidinol-phosphate transaminase [Methylococcales bacterium]|nr:histidinol-phosphate transaminase [Methylococcales bacterium]
MPNLPARLFRPELLSMSAYKVADAKNLIKLDAMENPYPWPENIQQAWLEALKACAINRYPDPEAGALSAELRRSQHIPENSAMLLGNGSDEIIQILLMALAADACILAPEPGFVMYRQVAQSLGLHYRGVPLRADSFELDMPAMLTAIQEWRPALIFLAYPNNPTGNLFDLQSIKQILAASSGLVVIDEAYAPFADASFIGELENYNNLLVMRTLSKLGLAGLRLGYLLGQPEIVGQLNKIRLPYNINCLTQATAEFALKNGDFLQEQTQNIREQRCLVYKALQAFENIEAYHSAANFILFRTKGIAAGRIFESLKQQGVLIKNLSPQGGLLENCLRVTIGAPDENQVFLNALQQALIL